MIRFRVIYENLEIKIRFHKTRTIKLQIIIVMVFRLVTGENVRKIFQDCRRRYKFQNISLKAKNKNVGKNDNQKVQK